MLDERFDYPAQWDKTKDARITPLRDDVIGAMRPALLATLGAMALILLIACANVAALMLGQVDARSVEFAVRSALGASRRRLTQPLIVEALLIATAAGALGAALAWGGFTVVTRALPLGRVGRVRGAGLARVRVGDGDRRRRGRARHPRARPSRSTAATCAAC